MMYGGIAPDRTAGRGPVGLPGRRSIPGRPPRRETLSPPSCGGVIAVCRSDRIPPFVAIRHIFSLPPLRSRRVRCSTDRSFQALWGDAPVMAQGRSRAARRRVRSTESRESVALACRGCSGTGERPRTLVRRGEPGILPVENARACGDDGHPLAPGNRESPQRPPSRHLFRLADRTISRCPGSTTLSTERSR